MPYSSDDGPADTNCVSMNFCPAVLLLIRSVAMAEGGLRG